MFRSQKDCGGSVAHPLVNDVESAGRDVERLAEADNRVFAFHGVPTGHAGQGRKAQVRAGQVRAGQVRVGQVALGQVRAGQVRAGQVRAVQVRAGQVRAGQVRAGQVRAGQVRAVRFAPVRSAPVRSRARTGSRRSGPRRLRFKPIKSVSGSHIQTLGPGLNTHPSTSSSGCGTGAIVVGAIVVVGVIVVGLASLPLAHPADSNTPTKPNVRARIWRTYIILGLIKTDSRPLARDPKTRCHVSRRDAAARLVTPLRETRHMLDDSDCPPCVIDGCDDPRYRDFDRCHWHHREQRLPLPPGMSPAPSTGAA